ncbi:MAG: mechanosensitive ion channel family protein [Candidatus Binatia bacterium]
MDSVIDQIGQIIGGYMPHLAGALAILILGWLGARVVAAIIRRGLGRTNLPRAQGVGAIDQVS